MRLYTPADLTGLSERKLDFLLTVSRYKIASIRGNLLDSLLYVGNKNLASHIVRSSVDDLYLLLTHKNCLDLLDPEDQATLSGLYSNITLIKEIKITKLN